MKGHFTDALWKSNSFAPNNFKRSLHLSNFDLRGCVKGETSISEVLPCKEFFYQQLCKDDRDD